MKKFASLLIAMLLVVSMVSMGIMSASAAAPGAGIDFTKKASIEMLKTDLYTGSPVDGAEFKAYKVLALNDDGETDGTYTVESAYSNVISANDLKATGKENSKGGLYVSLDAVEAKVGDLESCSYNDTTGKAFTNAGDGEYTIDGLDLGVYLIVETNPPKGHVKSTAAFLVSVPQWDSTNEEWDYTIGDGEAVKPKNMEITLDKTQGGSKEKDVYETGETISYTVVSSIPDFGNVKNLPNEPKYTSTLSNDDKAKVVVSFKDEMSAGLTYSKDLSITIGRGTNALNLTSEDTDYFKTFTETNSGFVLIFNFAKIENYQGSAITLTYSATLNENAVVDDDPNDNVVTYEFTNNITPGKDFPPPTKVTDETSAYTFAMNFYKTFEGKTAADAKVDATKVTFKLIDKATGKFVAVKSINGGYAIDAAATPNDNNTVVALKSDGSLYVKGLKNKTYYLDEVSTVDGYRLLTSKVELALTEVDLQDGDLGVKAVAYESGTEKELTNTGTNTFELKVNNVKNQFTLPQTGGLGTWMFTISGGILMAGAIILFVSIRRKKSSK